MNECQHFWPQYKGNHTKLYTLILIISQKGSKKTQPHTLTYTHTPIWIHLHVAIIMCKYFILLFGCFSHSSFLFYAWKNHCQTTSIGFIGILSVLCQYQHKLKPIGMSGKKLFVSSGRIIVQILTCKISNKNVFTSEN